LLRRGTPSLHPLKSRDWRGVCKNGPQNIELLRVRGQNIEFKELAGVFVSGSFTAFALAIMCSLKFSRKGRYHIGLWISLLAVEKSIIAQDAEIHTLDWNATARPGTPAIRERELV
jgi:hypothetical protein